MSENSEAKRRKMSSTSSIPHDDKFITVEYRGSEVDVESVGGGYIHVPDLMSAFGLTCSPNSVGLLYMRTSSRKMTAVSHSTQSNAYLKLPNGYNGAFTLTAPDSITQLQQVGGEAATSNKPQEAVEESLVADFKQFMFHFHLKWDSFQKRWIKGAHRLCATVVDSTWAITAAHCLLKDAKNRKGGHYPLQKETIDLHDESGRFRYKVTVEMINTDEEYDFAWLKIVEGKFPHSPKAVGSFLSLTDRLIYLGYPTILNRQSLKLCALRGSVLSLLYSGRIIVSSPGSYHGFSGGGVFDGDGCSILLGIILGGYMQKYEDKCLTDKDYHGKFVSQVSNPSQCFILSLPVAIGIRQASLGE